MSTRRRSATLVAALAAAVVFLAACGEDVPADPIEVEPGEEQAEVEATPAPSEDPAGAEPPDGPPEEEAAEAREEAAPPEEEPSAEGITVPDTLDFTAPAVGGGEVDGAAFAGMPVALWFWAPW